MLSLKLVKPSLLVFSIASVSLLGTLAPPANACDCVGDQCPPKCSSPSRPSQQRISIRYTITNKTNELVRFGLPSGKVYELKPGQRGAYRNTGYPDGLNIFILNTDQIYRLSSGNFQFRQHSDGEIVFRSLR